jgi:UBA-like domain
MVNVTEDAIANFLAITNTTDKKKAKAMIEAFGGNLDSAVNFHCENGGSMGGDSGGGGKRGAGWIPPEQDPSHPDYVRPADSVKKQRLMEFPTGHGGMHSRQMMPSSNATFRNCNSEKQARAENVFAAPEDTTKASRLEKKVLEGSALHCIVCVIHTVCVECALTMLALHVVLCLPLMLLWPPTVGALIRTAREDNVCW